MDLIQEMFCKPENVWNSYNIANFVINVLIAIGTIGAVWTSLYLARPKKEKLEGKYNYSLEDYSYCSKQYDSINGKAHSYLENFLISLKNLGSLDIEVEKIIIFTKKGIGVDTNSKFPEYFKKNGKNIVVYSNSQNYVKKILTITFFNKEIDPQTDIKKVVLYTTKNNTFELKYDKNLKELE